MKEEDGLKKEVSFWIRLPIALVVTMVAIVVIASMKGHDVLQWINFIPKIFGGKYV